MSPNELSFLTQRRSVPALQLHAPGPTAEQLEALVRAAIRVPDHGKLTPWRVIAVEGAALQRLGGMLATIHAEVDTAVAPSALEKDQRRFSSAPLLLIVVARLEEGHSKVPMQEQLLSAGCVAYNVLLGAQAMGFGAQWLTGWAAYDGRVAAFFGLAPNERIIAFVPIGTPAEAPPERDRPALDRVFSRFG